ncbi:MAG TPA: hypothetical protein VNO21_27295 [Polyangiaceae bacterium]|nr:hypothetical protein [Polyangiaceae bacterium]
MNPLQNLPVILRYEDDGSISAHCPLLPSCQCKSSSRVQALRTMQQLIKRALANSAPEKPSRKYEVVHLAVTSASDSVNRFGKRRPEPESPRLELL